MTGKVLNNGSTRALVLILPLAFSFVVLYMLWPFLLLLVAIIVAFKIWQNYQWQKWSGEINPYFNQLIKENQGYLTPVDLSLKANLTAKAAKVFLARKSEEYGTKPQTIEEKGIVYYFPTASALGSIFDDSEPEAIENQKSATEDFDDPPTQQQSEQVATDSEFATITEADSQSTTVEAESEADSSTIDEATSVDGDRSLIQAELAKRLDLNSSTVGRRKSDPDFEEWSQSKDPEGIAWKYESEDKLFLPVDSN